MAASTEREEPQGTLVAGESVPRPDADPDPGPLAERLRAAGPFDVVVGINARNVETTILHVLSVVSEGLQRYYFDRRCLVVVVDGHSEDSTVRLAEFFPTPRVVRKAVVRQSYGPGKGNGVRTLLDIARLVDAHAVAFVDGDLVSIRPIWVDNLLRPILHGLADLVVPYYLRDKWDGVITNHLTYPFTAALYGTAVRQPIGGEYALSRTFLRHLAERPDVPGHFGIDIFLTTSAVAEGFRVMEAPLGVKIHASTTSYVDPRATLSRMYLEVVGTMLDLAARYEPSWRGRPAGASVLRAENVVSYYDRMPPPTRITEATVRAVFQEGLAKHEEALRVVLEPRLLDEVRSSREGGIAGETWVRVAYDLAAWVVTHPGDPRREEVLHALGALGMGRFLRFVDRTRSLDLQESHEVIREQAQRFERLKPEFVARVDAWRAKGGAR